MVDTTQTPLEAHLQYQNWQIKMGFDRTRKDLGIDAIRFTADALNELYGDPQVNITFNEYNEFDYSAIDLQNYTLCSEEDLKSKIENDNKNSILIDLNNINRIKKILGGIKNNNEKCFLIGEIRKKNKNDKVD